MAKTKISEFSTTPGNNTDINGINISEGCPPSGINNAIRELMSDLKEWQSGAMDVYVIPQGSIASPGLQLYGDLDTGFYGDAANQLGVAVGGSSVGYFSASGWVGNVVAQTIDLVNIEVTNIKAKDGTASIALADSTGVATFSKPTVMSVDSASDALRITQIGAGNALLVEDSANPDTSPFVVTAAGLVGVGTLNPTRTIHVSAASGLPGITLESTSSGSSSNGVVLFNRTTTSASVSQTIGSALWSHNLTDSTSVTAASIIVTGNNTAGSNTANMAIDAKTSTIMKVNGTEVANFASGGLNVTGTVDVTSIETTNIKAKDGTAAASIADSTGVMTIASSVLTTTDINGGTIDGAVIGGSSAAAGTFTTITGTQVNSDNLRLDGNTLSSTDTNGNITIAPNGTGQVVMSGDLDVANIETGAIKARDGTAGATIANSTGQFTFNANIKRGVLELGQPTGLNVAMIKATNTNGPVFIQANGTGPIFLYADETTLVPNGTTAKLTTDSGCDLVLDTNGGSDSGSITIQDGVNGNIVIAPNGTGQVQLSGALDVTDIEVTNIKAKDGTAALSIADSTGVVSVSANPVLSGGTANGVLYLNGSKAATSDANLTYNGSVFAVGTGANTRIVDAVGASNGVSYRLRNWDIIGCDTGTGLTLGGLTGSQWTNLQVFTSGTEKLRITSGGQVNIGGNFTSTNNTLQVTGNAAIGYTTAAPTTGLIVAGNVGVGTDAPAYKLDVTGSANITSFLRVGATPATGGDIRLPNTGIIAGRNAANSSNRVMLQLDSSDRVLLQEGSVVIDSSGNLGLGTTPSAWGSDRKAMQVNLASLSGGNGNNFAVLGNNIYHDGTNNRYIATAAASSYVQNTAGAHIWNIAPSGTAGNAITFTQAMTLDASGNLVVGTTGTAQGRVHAHATTNAQFVATDATLGATYGGVFRGYGVGAQGGYAELGVLDNGTFTKAIQVQQQATVIAFFTGVNSAGNAERARITSGGDFLIGGITAVSIGTKLEVSNATGASAAFVTAQVGDYTVYSHNKATSGDNSFINFGTEATFTGRGSITYNRAGGAVAYNTTSDYRAKEIIGPVQNSGQVIDALKVYTGKMKGATIERPMLVAHEAQEHVPYAVTGEKDAVNEDGTPKYQQMDVSSLVPLLLAEIQSLRARVAQLEGK